MSAITVSIRLDENTIISDERDAKRLKRLVQHPDFIEGSREYLLAYATEDSPFKGWGLCAPTEEGIVAIDLPSRRIVTHCYYQNWLTNQLHYVLSKLYFQQTGPYDSLEEGWDIWRRLFEQKRVSLGIKWHEPYGPDPDTSNVNDLIEHALTMDLSARPRWEAIPTAMEVLTDLKSASERIHALEEQRIESKRSKEAWPEIDVLHVDISPWIIEECSFDAAGSEAARQRLSELGFRLSETSASAWDGWSRNRWRPDEDESA